MKIFENFWIWKTNELIMRLKNDLPVNEGLYGLFFWLMYMALPVLVNLPINENMKFQLLEDFIGLGIIYFLNYTDGNKNFLKKIICLFTPVTVRVLVVGLIIKFIINFTFRSPDTRILIEGYTSHLMNILILGLLIFYMIRIKNSKNFINN